MKTKKIKLRRNIINRKIRLGILVVVGLLIILSAYSAVGAYQQPTTKEETLTTPACSYTHSGTYNFLVYLKNNSLFGENITLSPGQATIFKKLVDHINASFTYQFQANQTATVQGTYTLEAQIQTDIWSKTYTITPSTSFNSSTGFTIDFPLNTSIYEDIVNKINEETGVIAQTPILILKCTVLTTAETPFGEIREAFAPSIQIPLSGNVLGFGEGLSTKQPGTIEKTETIITKLDTSQQQNTWIIATTSFSVTFILFAVFTASCVEIRTQADKMLRKIQKKYKDWIVEADKLPLTSESKTISMKSFDDLLKISEEIGKPVVYQKTVSNPDLVHSFYVFDEGIFYQYTIPSEEIVTQTTKCPKCGNKIECEGVIGKTIDLICRNCDNKGFYTFHK